MCNLQWTEGLGWRLRIFCRKWIAIPYFVLLSLLSSSVLSEILFQEVSGSAGIVYFGQSYGASWGDFDGDGFADLWVNNHLQQPDLYRNNGNGTFTDILLDVWSSNPRDDTHGATWGDFDNDGDQDLIELVGAQAGTGQGPNHFFINQDGILVDMATALGVDYPLARGRTALWLDWNDDGLLDVLLSSNKRSDGQAPSALFEQIAGSFQNVNDTVGFEATKPSNFSQLSDLTGDGILDLVVHGINYPQRVYDITQQPIVDLQSTLGLLPQTTNVWDAAIADLNGDLRADIFLTRVVDARVASDLLQESDTSIKVRLVAKRNEKGFHFSSTGDAFFDLYQTAKSEIFIGALGQNPLDTSFTLLANDPSVWGIQTHVAGSDAGTFIGYDPETQVWQLLLSTPASSDALNGIIQTVVPATEVTAIGFDPASPPLSDRLLVQTVSGFEDQTIAAGLNVPTSCNSVAAGDLDNDMDVDLYLVCNRPTANLPNILYENLGNGTFVPVADAGGAFGSTIGRGENVVLADYDRDGFLDLFLTNGMFNPPFNNGPQQLFRNQGNTNHWIEIDLEGSVSNRDGIGAQVLVTAGGTTQLREQDGGVHRHAQNHKRIHFGLGSNDTVDEILVRWPSGIIQQLEAVTADQVFVIKESGISLSINDVVIDERAGTVTFTVDLSQPSTQTVTVSYATADGTATAGEDYLATFGELVFMPGETRQTITMDIVQDDIDESDETFQLTLSSAVGAVILDSVAIATISHFSTWFNEVTEGAGLTYSGQSYGGAWGDFDGDGWPDLYTVNHQEPPSLYLNQGNGTFIDRALEIVPQYPERHDLHGAAWADFDNDGDQDLVQLAGFRSGPGSQNFLYINEAGVLADRAPELGVALPEQLARTPLWLDWNQDGLLDLMITTVIFQTGDPASLLTAQTQSGFEDARATTGLDVVGHSTFSVLSDLSGDGRLDLVVHTGPPLRVYDVQGTPFEDITADLSFTGTNRILDLVTGDFNGDLRQDFLVVRGETFKADLKLESSTRLFARLKYDGQEQGFSFQATGDVTFTLYGPDIVSLLASEIYIGKDGYNPSSVPTFSLSPDDSSNWGLTQSESGVNDGVRLGYDPAMQIWTVAYTGGRRLQFNAIIEASGGLSDAIPVGFNQFLPSFTNQLFIQGIDAFSDETINAGLTEITNCTSAAAADFDNDMDLDLYVVCSGVLDNLPNLYYENLGDGTFSPIPQGAGAEGTTVGRGDSVVVADYDQDGFPDLFVSNGMSLIALTPFNGPYQLFHNSSNSNHWLEIDLEGKSSNADAVGAVLWITTPDGKTQVREQNGGVHRAAQNHQRIHVGLGSNTSVSNISVHWPNGLVQDINNVSVDQILRIVEGETVNNVPSATSGGIIIFQNDTGSVQVNVDDPDVGEAHTYAVTQTGVLGGVSSVDAFGLVTYDATGATPGTEDIEVTVTDQGGAGLSVPVSIPITVNAIGEADSNGDGVTDAQAIALGLDPTDADGDTDSDGIPDANEIGDPDPAKAFDIDGDGIIDALEEGAKASDGSVAGGLAVEGSDVEILSAGQILSEVSSAPIEDGPPGVSFPFGMISYKTTSPLGGNVIVRMTFSTALPSNLALYKVDNAGTFILLPSSIWKQVNSTTLDITLTDGDPLTDLDGVANGEIVDPIAPADTSETITEAETTTATSSSGDGGGGCTLNPGKERDATLPLLILIFVAYLMRRRIWLK